MQKKYSGSCYIGVVGAETDNGQCYDSIMTMIRRPGDQMQSIRATKGFEARQTHLNNFIESKCDFLFLMDSDMIFPEGTLERLRSHGLPYVSGLYMRRTYAPIAPIWFKDGPKGQFPLQWWTGKIEANTLYKIGASGWGCVLIHRDVILGTRRILKGEAEIIEDDMDVYPYDLGRVMESIACLERQINHERHEKNKIDLEAIKTHVRILREEIRPLRGLKTNVGSDLRFPFYAKLAGWQLYGDSGAPCGHMLNYPLKPTDFPGMFAEWEPNMTADLSKAAVRAYQEERRRVQKALEGVR